MPRCVADIFIVHGFVVNNAVLLCGFKQTKGKRYETSDSFDRTAAGIGHSVCVNHLCPVVAGGGGMKDEALKLALDDLIAEYHMETSSFAKRVDEIFKQALAAPTVQEPVAHCAAGPEYCQQCHLEDRSLALAAAVRYVQNNTPKLVSDEICMALTTPPAQPAVPLTPEQRKALILQECRYTSEAENADHDNLIQAVERWYGITAAPEKGQP